MAEKTEAETYQFVAEKIGEIIAKAWSDPSFKERLKSDPRGACVEMGLEYPEEVELKVVEDTEREVFIHLPPAPSPDMFGTVNFNSVQAVGSSSGRCRCFQASV